MTLLPPRFVRVNFRNDFFIRFSVLLIWSRTYFLVSGEISNYRQHRVLHDHFLHLYCSSYVLGHSRGIGRIESIPDLSQASLCVSGHVQEKERLLRDAQHAILFS